MSKNKIRNKRVRRQNKQALRYGSKAKPTHKGKSGRTGKMFTKQLKVKKDALKLHSNRIENV